MPRFALRLHAPKDVSPEEAASSFYLLQDPRSSFTPGLTPSLGAFGPVSDLNTDFVRIALAVYAADRSTPRHFGGSNWNSRNFELRVPVSKSSLWQRHSDELQLVVGFLSGDRWTFTFVEEQAPTETVRMKTDTPERVVLLSGGADSTIGALLSRSQLGRNEHHILLSHFSANFLAPIQRRIASELERLMPGPTQEHEVVHLARVSKRLDGTNYPDEFTTRSRSLLFLALGLAVASVHDAPLWIPENGFASLNPPLGPERRGSLSTRTTHPAFIDGLAAVLNKVGAYAVIENPFAGSTKGEMYERAAQLIGDLEASALLSATHSCSLTGQRGHGIAPGTPCGVCFGCIIRRASFAASGVQDRTGYIEAGENAALARWLAENSVEVPVRNFIQRGVRERDLIALSVPANYPLREAMDLCQRGIAELRSLYP
jgi:7-cyano-7-deazaguanine synthase in queuosine biosynthesis